MSGEEPTETISPEVWARIAADIDRLAWENDELRAEILRLRDELRRPKVGVRRSRILRMKRGK